MKRDAALSLLKIHQAEFLSLGVKSLSIFGSTARDEAGPGSEVDILVEFSKPVGLFEFIRLKNRLEELLGHPVDLVTPDAIRVEMRERILQEAIRA